VTTEWLPELVKLESCGGDWTAYVETLYRIFHFHFIQSPPKSCLGKRWAVKKHPMELGKEATFWHVISEGQTETERTPDLRRCERLHWIRPMVDAIGSEDVKCWKNMRKGHLRLLISTPDFSFVVILQESSEYVMLWTAYYVESGHRREKLKREWEEYHKRQAPPS
jgi:hypothetical protein